MTVTSGTKPLTVLLGVDVPDASGGVPLPVGVSVSMLLFRHGSASVYLPLRERNWGVWLLRGHSHQERAVAGRLW